MYMYIYIFPKQWFLRCCSRALGRGAAPGALCAASSLCAGCGLAEGHVAPVYAKRSLVSLFDVKHLWFFLHFTSKTSLEALVPLGASGCPLGACWLPPGCFLGASCVPPGCFLAAQWVGVSWVPPDVPRLR